MTTQATEKNSFVSLQGTALRKIICYLPLTSNAISSSSTDSLYTDTKIAPFHQITAVSQDTINHKLKYDWAMSTTLGTFNISIPATDPDYSVNAILSAPSVSLIGQNGGTELFFTLNFQSGTFMYWTGHNPPVQHQPDMKGWKIAFKVSLDQQGIDPSAVPQKAKDNINVPGSYSISQLLVDFTTADLNQFEPNLSSTPGLDIEGQGYLSMCISDYLNQVSSQGGNILGYTVTVPSTAGFLVPTFPPTASKFQIIPFYDGNNKILPSSSNNAIAFLEMTNNAALPQDLLQWSANWLPTSYDATMTICKANIWDNYLVPRLAMYHRLILQRVNEAAVWIYCQGTTPGTMPWYLSSNDPDATTASQQDFDSQNKWAFVAPTSTTPIFTYTCTIPHQHLENDVIDSNPSYLYTWDTDVTNTLTFGGPGSNSIVITTSATCLFSECVIVNERDGPSTTIWNTTITLTPTYTLTLVPGANGVLDIVSAISANPIKVTTEDGGIAGWFNAHSDANNATLCQSLTTFLTTHQDLTSVNTDLQDALGKQNAFVFAGNSAFAYKGANFNAEGDLIAGLFYNDGDLVEVLHN